jgi:hypothetical protein
VSDDQDDESLAGDKKLEQIAARLANGQRVEPVPVRELLDWFGAQRRSIPTNRMIREALFQKDLRIEPDLHETYLDDDAEFRIGNIERKKTEELPRAWMRFELLTTRLAAWIDRQPDATQTEIQIEFAALEKLGVEQLSSDEGADLYALYEKLVQGIERDDGFVEGSEVVRQIAASLDRCEAVQPVKVRNFLRWFGTERRSPYTNHIIRNVLRANNLATVPDWNEQFLDHTIEFHEGYRITRIESVVLNQMLLELFCDRLVTWIDQNPNATEAEVRAQAAAFEKAGFKELPSDQGAEIKPLFPAMDPKTLSRVLSRVTKTITQQEPPVKPPPRIPQPLTEQHFSIQHGDKGHTYDTIFGDYLRGAKAVTIEDPYIRQSYQIDNFRRFCEMVVRRSPTVRRITLITGYDDKTDRTMVGDRLKQLKKSLLKHDVLLDLQFGERIHDREVRIDNGWTVKIGRGLDFYQRPEGWYSIAPVIMPFENAGKQRWIFSSGANAGLLLTP